MAEGGGASGVHNGGTEAAETNGGPIGIFDSGLGGLSLLAELRRQLPGERVVYVADSAYAPYGSRPPAEIVDRSLRIARYLEAAGAKAILVACNTATAVAVGDIRRSVSIPVVAIEPALKPAAAATRTGVVGVLATPATLASDAFRRLAASTPGAQIVARPCEGLVEEIERGNLDGPAVRRIVASALAPITAAGADTVVLGCTHYPLVRSVIEEIAGPAVTVIDPAAAVIRQLSRRLSELDLVRIDPYRGAVTFMTSSDPVAMARVLAALGETESQVLPLRDP